MQLTNEIFSEIKDSIKGFPFIKDVKLIKDNSRLEVYFDREDNTYSLKNQVSEVIEKILAKYNMEFSGWSTIDNDDYFPALKVWKENNPEPADPRKDSSWRRRSYYDRTKGKGKKELDEYFKAQKEWRDKGIVELPPYRFPGFSASFEELGFIDKVFAFYSGTKYWGD